MKCEFVVSTFQDSKEDLIAGGNIFGIDLKDYDENDILDAVY